MAKETKPSRSDKDGEIHGVGWTEWCESDAEDGLFPLLKN